MVALLTEQRLSLAKLAKRERVHVSTVWRWCQRGVRGVKLDTITVGGRRYTTDSLYEQFVQRTTAAAAGEHAAILASSNGAAEHQDAEAELIASGA